MYKNKNGAIRWLLDQLGISKEALLSDDEEGFDRRLRVQKAAFLLKKMGIAPFTEYNFSLYIRGPYSPELAKDYYGDLPQTSDKVNIPKDKLEIFDSFMKNDEKWLEVATSTLMIVERYPKINKKEVLDALRLSKPWVQEDYFAEIYDKLKEMGLIGG